MRVLAYPPVRVCNYGVRSFQDDDRAPLLGRPARLAGAVGGDRLDRLAGQPGQLARVRREHARLAQLAFGTRRVRQRVEAVSVDHERAPGVKSEVEDQAPGRAATTEAR